MRTASEQSLRQRDRLQQAGFGDDRQAAQLVGTELGQPLGQVKEPVEPAVLPKLPKSIEEAMKADEVMVAPLIRTTISDDRGEEPCYDGYPASCAAP